jgi:16S rRNA (adenine1518-N6/adenine1519-N6)-dimethyltransferase
MSPSTLSSIDVPVLLKRYGLHPSKSLGQNFLGSADSLKKIISAADLVPTDDVLEIGPGLGSLTAYLAQSARHVTAVELDQKLIPVLNEVLRQYKNVRLLQGDILKIQSEELALPAGYIVVANIPYYITSAVIRHLLEQSSKPRRIVLTVQKEVAERICAEDGKMSLLALSVQVYGKPSIKGGIPAGAFYPPPNVDSSVLRVDIYGSPVISSALLDTFFSLVKAGFSQKRKTLRNSLSAGLRVSAQDAEALLSGVGIDPRRRAETLSLEEWGKLSAAFRPGY